MHFIDILIFAVYMVAMLGVGFYFLRQNQGTEDYYVGGRGMGSWHVGLSVVATDVGGGFSIGLGGLGFMMGIAGSWMLFTGLIGAWLAAVFLIPAIKSNPAFAKFFTLPEIFGHFYNAKVALAAAVISAIGYTGFTSSQILAGAKLATGTFEQLDINTALIIMGIMAVVYTVMGGIKAVIYTDTIQWIILLSGLIFIGIPFAFVTVGGWDGISSTLGPEFFSMTNLGWQDLLNWAVTIIPIWFVGMTLYQRIFACKDTKTAQKAWYIAGLFEWPIMAFMGVFLGLLARVAADQGMFDYLGAANISATDPETGLPMLLRTVLPIGLKGLMMSAYFSAILSTADSCLMAASGNVVSDLLQKIFKLKDEKQLLRFSQLMTFVIGTIALLLASVMTNVLDLMLYSYAFMVSGLFVPILAALFWKSGNSTAALGAMISGGTSTILLTLADNAAFTQQLPAFGTDFAIEWAAFNLPYGLDANIFGITISLLVFISLTYIIPNKNTQYKL